MKEIEDIIAAYEKACEQGKRTVLATVVKVDGSSYRRPGARMLVREDGKLTGAISGGCLEGDALRKAKLVISQNQSMLITYDSTDDDDKLGIGLGCSGIIHILIEPLNPDDENNPIHLFQRLVNKRQSAVAVTFFSLEQRYGPHPGTCLIRLQDGTAYENIQGFKLRDAFFADMRLAFRSGDSVLKTYDQDSLHSVTAFIQYIQPTVSLVIAGAGNDVVPLVRMANILGWKTTIIDGRANYATAERFPTADHLIVAKPKYALLPVNVDDRTVFVLMTHNYNYDLDILQQLIAVEANYIGVLGPKKKLERMLDELEQRGSFLTVKQRTKIFGPVGLDIGAEAPEEIALSIIAQIKAVLSGRTGDALKNGKKSIHAKPEETSTIALSQTG